MKQPETASDFYLGERSEYVVTDFDGRLRQCFVLGRLWSEGHEGDPLHRHVWISVDPPFHTRPPMEPPLIPDGPELVLKERHVGANLDDLGDRWISVHLCEVLDNRRFPEGILSKGAVAVYAWADVARLPMLLPRSREERFDRSFAALQRFVEREGHTDVPEDHDEGDLSWNWLMNMRYQQVHGHLRADWAERLEALPGWKWLPGDDVYLLRRFAEREGHTDVPLDHREEGRAIEIVVQHWREDNARSGNYELRPDIVRRLEQIPHWHW